MFLKKEKEEFKWKEKKNYTQKQIIFITITLMDNSLKTETTLCKENRKSRKAYVSQYTKTYTQLPTHIYTIATQQLFK